MGDIRLTRRRLLGAAGALPLVAAGPPRPPAEDPREDTDEATPRTAAEAIERLREGNRRFAEGKLRHAHQSAQWREQLKAGQRPFATLLACSDSRVPPELVFDQGLGDLFVIRVAGNVIATDVLGSIEYALAHLKTPLVIVLGHEGCGAVGATLEALDGKSKEPKFVVALAKLIEPGLRGLDPKLQGRARLSAAVEANVRRSTAQLAQIPEGRRAIEGKTPVLAAAVYDLGSGQVRFLA